MIQIDAVTTGNTIHITAQIVGELLILAIITEDMILITTKDIITAQTAIVSQEDVLIRDTETHISV